MSNVINGPKYTYSDLNVVPAETTSIEHRGEIDVRVRNSSVSSENGMFPIFAAPMDSVVNEYNYMAFKNNGIIPILNSTVKIEKRLELTKQGEWCAYSLVEFDSIFNNDDDVSVYEDMAEVKVLIELANGHMKHLLKSAKQAKHLVNEKFGDKCRLVIMTGNIANPRTYIHYCKAGIDYVRCSIGTGSCCLTASNAAVYYPPASLVMEIREIKKRSPEIYGCELTKIVADGGIKNFSDAIVALACGADYVMIGGLFSSFFESCAMFDKTYGFVNTSTGYFDGVKDNGEFVFVIKIANNEICKEYDVLVNRYGLSDYKIVNSIDARIMYISLTIEQMQIDEIGRWIIKHTTLTKSAHGMSTKEAQVGRLLGSGHSRDDISKMHLKTSEGKTITNEVIYTLKQWTDNFESLFRSTMSYCDKRQLVDFVGNVLLVPKSQGCFESVNR